MYCGFVIDLCTIPVFGDSVPMHSRLNFFKRHRYTFIFLHCKINSLTAGLVGTTFMFQFAVFIALIRDILRPGVLWFIRDPNDPNFNPMRDIYRRPFFNQLRKLFIGVCLYSIIIIGSVGGTIGMIYYWDLFFKKGGFLKIWPLRWEFQDGLTEVPVDLLMLHFFLPWISSKISPGKLLARGLETWFLFIAKKLRISAFLIGGEYPLEELGEEEDCEEVEPKEQSVNGVIKDDLDNTLKPEEKGKKLRYMRVPNRNFNIL